MTNRAQITRQAARDGVPAPTVERDYALAHIVAAIGTLADGHGLVFKGGTALRMCYFEDYRYSADLDFSVVDGDLDGAYATIDTALATVSGAIDALRLTDGEARYAASSAATPRPTESAAHRRFWNERLLVPGRSRGTGGATRPCRPCVVSDGRGL